MIERTRYISEFFGNREKFGVITILYDKGKFGVGISLCNEEDTFDKVAGKELARERALANLYTTNTLLKDLRNAGAGSPYRISRIGSCNLPLSATPKNCDRIFNITVTYRAVISDMVYTLALAKVRSECTNEV